MSAIEAVRDAIQCYVDDVCPDEGFMEARGSKWVAGADALEDLLRAAEVVVEDDLYPDLADAVRRVRGGGE